PVGGGKVMDNALVTVMHLAAVRRESQAKIGIREGMAESTIEPGFGDKRLAVDQDGERRDDLELSRLLDRWVRSGKALVDAGWNTVLTDCDTRVADRVVGIEHLRADNCGTRVGIGVSDQRVEPPVERHRVLTKKDYKFTRCQCGAAIAGSHKPFGRGL